MPFTITGSTEIPEGTYLGTLEKVEVGNSSFGDYRKWSFLIDVNGTLTPITAVTSMNTGPQAKAYRWLSAILRKPLKAGETLDDPVGQKAMITVGENAKGFPTIIAVEPYEDPTQVIPGIPR
jgi:hypothetical protein